MTTRSALTGAPRAGLWPGTLGLGLLAALAATALGAADDTLTADELVADVLEANPGLASLEAAVDEARARVAPAGALDDPTLSYRTAPNTFGSSLGDRHIVELSQSIPWPGTLGLRSEAAERRGDAVAHRLEAARLEVAALTRTAHAEWRFVHRALAVNADEQALLEDLKASAEALYAGGRASQQDVLRAERQRTRLVREAAAHERERRAIRAQINALLGRAAQHPLPPPGEPGDADSLPPASRLREAATEQHPELARLRDRVGAQQAEIGVAEKSFFPDLRLQAAYVGTLDPADKRLQVGVGINLPLNRGRRRAELDEAKAAHQRAQWDLTDRRSALLAELESAYAGAREARRVIALYEQRLLPLARATLDASLAAYESGDGDFLEVIEAEREVRHAELELARSRADYARHRAELRRWAGGELPAGPAAAAGNELEQSHE